MRCTGVADPGNANHALLCQNLLRAANDGYDVSTLIDHGADPMTSGTFCQPSPNPWGLWTSTEHKRPQSPPAHMPASPGVSGALAPRVAIAPLHRHRDGPAAAPCKCLLAQRGHVRKGRGRARGRHGCCGCGDASDVRRARGPPTASGA